MKKLFALTLVFALFFNLSAFASSNDGKSSLSDEPITLKIIGCGSFAASGPDGSLDAITGLEKPGYNMIVEAWNEQYPNVTLDIEPYPWDNWQAAIQTAVLAGGVDVIMHGATLTDLSMPLNDLIDADPEFDSKRLAYSTRRSETLGDLDEVFITGVPVTIAPMVVMINKEILENYGVELPDADWTWDDLLEIAKTCTGKDPVTGENTYGFQFHNSHSDNEIWKNFANIGYGIGADPTVVYAATAKESEVNYTDDNAMKIWDFIAELAKYTSPADREGIDPSKPEIDFNIAIYFTEAAIGSYKQLDAAGALDKYYVNNLPVISSGDLEGIVTPYCGDSNLAICNTSENKDWAWEFIKFNTTNPIAIEYYVENGAVANHVDEFSGLSSQLSQDWIDAISRGMSAIPSTYSPASGMYTNNISFGNLNATIGAGMRMIIMGTGDAAAAAELVQDTVDEYIKTLN